MKIHIKLLDIYFARPLLYDLLVAGGLVYIFRFAEVPKVAEGSSISFDNIYSNIISTMVSFAGFIITALTVIVTVKSSLSIRDIADAKNGLELLLSSKNYKRILRVFKYAVIELVLGIFVMYAAWTPYLFLTACLHLAIVTTGIFVIIVTIFRSVYVFFNIIFLEFETE